MSDRTRRARVSSASRVDIHTAHAIVTGGSSGIGRATVRLLASRGAAVSVLALPDADLQTTREQLTAAGARFRTEGIDVTDNAAVARAVDDCTAALGPCDILLTCAGVAHPGYFHQLDDAVYRWMIDVDYFGTLHAVRAVAPEMMRRRRGSIVGISSAAGLVGTFGYTAYAPAKFAVRGLLEALRCELAPYDVHVGCVFPPDTDTPQLAYENRFKPAETYAISGMIKPLTADRVASCIVRGIERRRFFIAPDWRTRALARTAGLLRGTYFATFDRQVRRARERPATTAPPVS